MNARERVRGARKALVLLTYLGKAVLLVNYIRMRKVIR